MHHNTAYGESRQTSGSTAIYNPFLYTGQELDSETGFYHLRARHYAPGLGRFLARDPIGYAGGSNLCGYCGGDPTNAVDPTGLETIPAGYTVNSYYQGYTTEERRRGAENSYRCRFKNEEYELIQVALSVIQNFDPDRGKNSFDVIKFFYYQGPEAWIDGAFGIEVGAKTYLGLDTVHINFTRLATINNYYDKVYDLTRSLANELYHVRFGAGATESAAYEEKIVNRWIGALQMRDSSNPFVDAHTRYLRSGVQSK